MARILVLDDDRDFLETLVETLASQGHEVYSSANGRQSLSLINGKSIELMITDIAMPEQEGLQTILEARKFYPSLKIIAMSGGGRLVSKDYLKVAAKTGADLVLAKPFSAHEIQEAVKKLLLNA